MSVMKRSRDDGTTAWTVRWFTPAGKKRRKTFDRKRDAEDWLLEVRRRKRLGELALMDAREQSLREYAAEWFEAYSKPHHAASTQKQARSVWRLYLDEPLGDFTLGELCSDPFAIQRWQAALAAEKPTPTVLKAMHLLQSMLQRAVEWNRIPTNPARACRKPKQPRTKSATVIAPERVELMRQWLLEQGRVRDATLISVLAYSGLRPGEALALMWSDIGARNIRVTKSNSNGTIKDTKTGIERTVAIMQPLRDDLERLMAHKGYPSPEAPIFGNPSGGLLRSEDWANWRNRVFQPAAREAGLNAARPYDLRHTFVSLLIEEGRSPIYAAAQAGHSPTMCLNTYAHVFAEYIDEHGLPAVERVRTARQAIHERRRRPLARIDAPDNGENHDTLTAWRRLALVD